MARDNIEVQLKSFCGLTIEQLYYSMLMQHNQNPDVKIMLVDSNNAINQIDLKIEKSWFDHESIRQTLLKTA